MSTVGIGTWYPKRDPTVFVVKNIAPQGKRIKIFMYPINNGETRDLMTIPYVSEADIRHSLLKGELMKKFVSEEAIVVDSNIDLLQFDDQHKAFLRKYGIVKGLEVSAGELLFSFKQNIELLGVKDGSNRVYTTPDKFMNGPFGNNFFKILVRHNGRTLVEAADYYLVESGGAGSGYDTIVLNFAPASLSVLYGDYVVLN
jgi:hypothetical protein